jgi:hypothetical protein
MTVQQRVSRPAANLRSRALKRPAKRGSGRSDRFDRDRVGEDALRGCDAAEAFDLPRRCRRTRRRILGGLRKHQAGVRHAVHIHERSGEPAQRHILALECQLHRVRIVKAIGIDRRDGHIHREIRCPIEFLRDFEQRGVIGHPYIAGQRPLIEIRVPRKQRHPHGEQRQRDRAQRVRLHQPFQSAHDFKQTDRNK